MSQTGYSKVQIYSSSTATNTPSASNLTNDTNGSELAINITDGKLFYKDNGGTVQVIASKASNIGNFSSDITVHGLTVGLGAGSVSTNTAVGASALSNSSQSGAYNTAFGYQSLIANTSGYWNTSIGGLSLIANTTGNNNTAVGLYTLPANTTGASNTALGSQALYSNTTASYNTAVGYQAGYSVTTNGYSTFLGYQAGLNTTGIQNTFVGQGAGLLITTGAQNTVLGGYNGNQGGLDIRTSSNYVVFSDGAGNVKGYFDGSGNLIGSARVTGTSLNITNSSTLQVLSFTYGSTQEWAIFNNTTGSVNNLVIQNSAGSSGVQLATQSATAWSAYSDPKLKNITGTYTNPLSDISEIKPIKFTWKSDSTNRPCVGVDATTVETVVPEAVDLVSFSQTDETKYLSVRYTELIPLCIASIQALNTLVTAQATEISTLKAKVGA